MQEKGMNAKSIHTLLGLWKYFEVLARFSHQFKRCQVQSFW